MRSAELSAIAVLALAAAGCSMLPTTEPIAAAPQPAASAPVAAASAPAPAPVVQAPVDANAQRAFDDARRALAAGRRADAERGFVALTKSHPDLGGPHANLGLLYRQSGKLKEAVSELETAARLSPQQPVYFNQLGIAYRHAGQFEKSRKAYERALELDAGYADATLNLGILEDLYFGNGAKALALYERYQTLLPAPDATVTKWVADLKNRKVAADKAVAQTKKERE
jgi:Flp pilus assembly protein TadD